LAASFLAVPAYSGTAASPPPTPGDIAIIDEGGHYVVRTDSSSLPIYVYGKDEPDKSNCNGRCANIWQPVLVSPGEHAIGDWTIARRRNGRTQWSFKHKPVYIYSKDSPGVASGDGLEGEWHVLKLGPSD